jgi:hypothetical protein
MSAARTATCGVSNKTISTMERIRFQCITVHSLASGDDPTQVRINCKSPWSDYRDHILRIAFLYCDEARLDIKRGEKPRSAT